MVGTRSWSYAPYKPFFYETGEIYLCRLAPFSGGFHAEWLSEAGCDYELMLRPEGRGEFVRAAQVTVPEATVEGLEDGQDYEFYVVCGEKKSRVRLVRPGEAVGTVVNYLHPRDEAYAFSGRYLCSPSMVKHPDGYLLASMDLFESTSPQNLTLIFRSDDGGQSWHYLTELYPCFWGRLFIHRGEVYMLACSTEYGDLLIGKSSDGGRTFLPPVTLLRGSNGKNGEVGVHKNPQPPVEYRGRLCGTLEWGSWGRGYHAAMVMSADIDADLLDPASWHFAPPVKYDPSWPGVAQGGRSNGNIEGTLAIAPDGTLYNVMRYDMMSCTPNYGLALAYRVNTEDPDAPLEYDHAIALPGNHSKFTIRRDDVTGKYYCVLTRILNAECAGHRNLLSLMVSDDMENWRVACDLIDRRNEDPAKIGFQYVDHFIDGEDLLFVCRTAMNGADSFHNNNYQTFHRVENVRRFFE